MLFIVTPASVDIFLNFKILRLQQLYYVLGILSNDSYPLFKLPSAQHTVT